MHSNPNNTNTAATVVLSLVVASALSLPLVAENAEVEEVVVTARSLSSAQELVLERMDDEVVIDILSEEAISRMGDSTVAAALRRVPGLSLVSDKYVYIRGLGERYSASVLNGARIPSPDLTRNVIPLDIFPTSIVESLRVQKAYSADMPANFGGGSVDIRTKGIPDDFTVALEISSSYNSENDRDGLTYSGGGDDKWGTDDGTRDLPGALMQQIIDRQANVDVQSILTSLRGSGNPDATLADAQLINRQMGALLNRNIGVRDKDISPDYGLKGSIGNNYLLSEKLELGFLLAGSYDNQWRNSKAVSRNFQFPDERTDTENETTRTVDLSGNLNFGVRYGEDHEISTTSLYIRNTDDETAVRDFFNENREVSDGIGFREYRLQYEERDVFANQIKGIHRLGYETREMLPGFLGTLAKWIPNETEFNWFASDAEAETEIPNQVNVAAQTVTDPTTGGVLSSSVALDSTAANFRFTDLDDEVENSGWSVKVPFSTDNSTLDVTVGYEHDRKAREYRQSQFSLGALSVGDTGILSGDLSDVFSDANILNPDNNFVFDIQGTNNQSYIAATMTDAWFGKFDWLYKEKWRVSAGARWEDYRQVALDWNPLGFNPLEGESIMSTDPDVLARGVFTDDKVYPAVALTYISDWMAETFQLRLGVSETTVRPDLREITDASYIDPITDDLVDGNPGVIPADVTNIDLRAEWFLSNGDNFTATLFYKDIDNPIEFFESAASDTTTAREIVNADSAEVYGLELEGLKALGFWDDQFFIKGTLTLQDSELVAGSQADAPTNQKRPLTGASDYVVNLALGFDSNNGKHSASLGYNVFDERLYVAGRNGAPDGYEQPFHSLDLTWSWYPTDTLTLKAKFRNILDESVEIEREGVTTFEEEVGSTFALSLQWTL